jgi:hypothetical protein
MSSQPTSGYIYVCVYQEARIPQQNNSHCLPSTHCLRSINSFDSRLDSPTISDQHHQIKTITISNKHGLQLIETPLGRSTLNTLPMPPRWLPARQKDSEEIPKSIQEASKAGSTQQVRRCDDKWRHHISFGVCTIPSTKLTISLENKL